MEAQGHSLNEPVQEEQASKPKPEINQEKLRDYMERLGLEQNLPMGLIAGIIASIIGAVIWAAISLITNYQIGFMAVGVGFLVGFSIRLTGKGIDKIFGIFGGLLSLIGCMLGNFFIVVGSFSDLLGIGYFEVLSVIDFSQVTQIMIENSSPMDFLFYAIAVYEGFKFSFRQITDEEILQHAAA